MSPPLPRAWIVGLVAAGSVAGCAPPLAADTLDALLDEALALDLPGIIVVARQGDDDFAGAAGWADVDARVPMTPETGFRIASNSKVFVGLTLASLAQDGLVDLDAPLGDLLPAATTEGIENARAATARQALQHTSGIADYLDDPAFWDAVAAGRDGPWTIDDGLAYARGLPAYGEIGEDWAYSNTNYLLAGSLIEVVTGSSWGAAVRSRVMDPAGMEVSFIENEEEARTEIAHGYARGRRDMYAIDTGYGLPDGGIVATAPELAAFVRAVGGGEAPAGWPAEPARALLEGAVSSGDGERYGLGLAEITTGCGRTVAHGGALDGYLSEMFYAPDRDVTLVVFVNASDGRIDARFGAVVERALEIVCGS